MPRPSSYVEDDGGSCCINCAQRGLQTWCCLFQFITLRIDQMRPPCALLHSAADGATARREISSLRTERAISSYIWCGHTGRFAQRLLPCWQVESTSPLVAWRKVVCQVVSAKYLMPEIKHALSYRDNVSNTWWRPRYIWSDLFAWGIVADYVQFKPIWVWRRKMLWL